MPHGGCYFWRPDILWLHAVSDSLIVLAYFLIPFSLVQLVRKRKDLEFDWMFLLFGLFILSCGLTHAMSVFNIWHSAYRLEGVVKGFTAVVSLPVAFLMFRLVPKALLLPSVAQLRNEIDERSKAEEEVRNLNAELEQRVKERTARLSRSNEALQRFAYIASHDLQEPIRTVKSMNQLLARDYRGRLDKRADQYLSFVLEASDRMETLVSDLLVYSQAVDESGFKPASVANTEQVVREALADMSASINDSGAEIHFRNLPEVSVDAVHLKQIFQNLLSNAVKYRREDERPLITISADDLGGECLFSVQDNGIGIEPQYTEQIFIAFKRLHGRNYPGSGVGLTICKSIVEGYGGGIWVESQKGQGSRFCFTLPLAGGAAPTRAPDSPVQRAVQGGGKAYT